MLSPFPLVEKTSCELAREAALKLPPIGRFVPSCKKDGNYKEKQCYGSTGFCWCVDKNGREWFGSTKRGHVDCPKDSKLIIPIYLVQACL